MKRHPEGALPERITLNREIAAVYGVPLELTERTEDEHRRCQSLTAPSNYRPQRQCCAKALPGGVHCFRHRRRPS